MKLVSSSPVEPADLLDLKLLPAWVKEPREARNYERYTGEEESGSRRAGRGAPRGKHPQRRTPINRKQPPNTHHRRQRGAAARDGEGTWAPANAVRTSRRIAARQISIRPSRQRR